MMIEIFSVFDSKTKIYSQPQFMLNKGVALRTWVDVANDPQSAISKHPGDYSLFKLGVFNDETGQITMDDAYENLGTALQYKNDQQQKGI